MAVAAGTAVCMLGGGAAAIAADTGQRGGEIHVFVTEASHSQAQTESKVLITGAIGDYGVGISENASGKPDPGGDFESIRLRHGTFLVDATDLNNKLNEATPTVNESNCSVVFQGSGNGTIEDGTGDYTGISGNVTLTVVFAGIVPKTANGCDMDESAPVAGAYQSITGVGHVSFP
jgi:hypothetical protein